MWSGGPLKGLTYPGVLRTNDQALRTQICELEVRRERKRATAEATLRNQSETIRHLEEEEIEIVQIINTLKAMESDGEGIRSGPKSFSCKTYQVLVQQLDDLEEKKLRLDCELSEATKKFHCERHRLSYVELCRKKTLQLGRKTAHKENELAYLSKILAELRNSCKILSNSINSLLRTRYAFYKRQNTMHNLLWQGREDIHEITQATNIAYQRKDKELNFSLLYQRVDTDKRKMSECLADMKEILRNEAKIKGLKLSEIGKQRVLGQRHDPFAPQCRDLSYREKQVRSDVILSRIFQESEERDVRSICRKYSENEMENRSIFERIEAMFFETENLFLDVRAMRIENMQESLQKAHNLNVRQAELAELAKAREKLCEESNEIEALVDDQDVKLAYVKRMLCAMLQSCAPKCVMDNLQKTSIDYDLILYMNKFADCVKLLMNSLVHVTKMQLASRRSE